MHADLSQWLLAHYGQEQMRISSKGDGLSRVRSALGNILPELNKKKIVIIAGTNGKGETTLRLSELLKDKKHVVWTSPHIRRITERFRSESGEISEDELQTLVSECHKKVTDSGMSLSYYEFLFLVFCTWAHRRDPDYILLEVGLGGRLDAVNVFDADIVLLPSISRDHQEILGKRYDQILSEKLGTLRSKSTLIHYLSSRYLSERALKAATTIGAKVVALEEVMKLPDYEFSYRNYILAQAGYSLLMGETFQPERCSHPEFSLENRGEILHGENEWLFFGSHNVDGLRKLIQFLQSGTYNFKKPPFDAVIVAFSKRSPEDLKVMLRMLKQAGLGKVLVTVFDHPKAASAKEMEALSQEEGSEFVQNIESYVQGQNKNQRVLVTGSYYFLGYFKSLPCCQ